MSALVHGPWLKQPMERDVHVVLLDEVTRHEMDAGCWCRPRVESVACTAALVITHRSADDVRGGAS